jgi:dephospho-CoA kinase
VAKLRVGLTGGIGSGKSAAASFLAARGATVIDADALAREAVAPGSEGLRAIAERWPQVVAPDGTLDRAAMAGIVFADPAARAALNAIVHPSVRARAAELEREAPEGIVVHMIPLLFEGDYWRACDKNVLVVAPDELRVARVVARDGGDRDAVERRMAAQIDPALARRRADYVIENDGDLALLRQRSERVYDALLADLDAIARGS